MEKSTTLNKRHTVSWNRVLAKSATTKNAFLDYVFGNYSNNFENI